VEAASEIADGTGSELYLVHVWPDLPPVGRIGPTGPIADDFVREPQQEAEELSRRQAWRAESAGATVAEKHLRVGRPAEEIAALADEVGADLVVLGSRQMGTLKRLVLGSTPQEVVPKAARPVLVVRGGWPPSRVVVGDDLSEEAGRAGELTAIIGGIYEAPVRLTTAYPPSNTDIRYAANRRRARETERGIGRTLRGWAAVIGHVLGKTPQTEEVAPRRPEDVLQGASRGAKGTLVAIGRRALGAVRRAVLGGVSDGVLRAAGGPVLIAPTADKGSPNAGRTRGRPQHRSLPIRAPVSREPRTNERVGGYPR
jgi:nucleotide-binding universal stress UspA family protein